MAETKVAAAHPDVRDTSIVQNAVRLMDIVKNWAIPVTFWLIPIYCLYLLASS
jgi:hypothetical protein